MLKTERESESETEAFEAQPWNLPFDQTDIEILTFIGQGERGAREADIAKAIGLGPGVCKHRLNTLRASGLVTSVRLGRGHVVYCLTERAP